MKTKTIFKISSANNFHLNVLVISSCCVDLGGGDFEAGYCCYKFKDCVQCQMYKAGEMGKNADLCAETCTQFVSKGVNELVVNKGDNLCQFSDENNCQFDFLFNYDKDDKLQVTANRELQCPSLLRRFIFYLLRKMFDIDNRIYY